MKAILIFINFGLSIFGLMLGFIGALWFFASCAILIRADKKGTMDKLMDKFGLN